MSDKLNRYNQKILAVGGTLIIFGVILFILLGGIIFVSEIFTFGRHTSHTENSLIINKDETKITQEISLNTPILTDTLKGLYIIPVSHTNAKNSNNTRSTYDKTDYSYSYKYYNYSGVYNNIIIYNQINNTKQALFDSKINIKSFQNYYIKEKQYLFITGTHKDSNNDKKLNNSDLQSFYIYSFDSNKTNIIEFKNMGLVDFSILHNTDEIILRFGKDKNKNGVFINRNEPIFLKKYSISENKTEDLIGNELYNKLQKSIN